MQHPFTYGKIILSKNIEFFKGIMQKTLTAGNSKFLEIAFFNIVVAALAVMLFIPYIGAVPLFDWYEASFAESAREMIISRDFFSVQNDFQAFWEKPPLFMWIQAISMYFFGVNEFASRLPNALVGILTLLALFNIGTNEFDKRFGLFWVMTYSCSILPHFYSKSGIIDPAFNFFIFLGIYQFVRLTNLERREKFKRIKLAFWAGLFIGLAVLTKGPVAFLIVWICLVVYFIVKRSLKIILFKELMVFTAVVLIFPLCWFLVGMYKYGIDFFIEFIDYQIQLFSTEDSGHGGPFFYHFMVLLVGCFPASVFVFKSFIRQYSDTTRQRNFKLWMTLSLLIVLILFSVVQTKIIHYSSFCYFPISFLAAYVLYKTLLHKIYFSKNFHIWFVTIGGILSFILIAFPLLLRHKYKFLVYFGEYISNEMLLEAIRFPVEWTGSEVSIGCFYLATVVLAMVYFTREPVWGAGILFVSTLITVQLTMYLIIPKIENHMQGGLVEFYKSLKGKDVYIESVGFKSNVELFYTHNHNRNKTQDQLLFGPIEKPAYFVREIDSHKELDLQPSLQRLDTKNGYVFYRRNP